MQEDSPYQKAVFEAVQFTKSNIVVRSTAGSGKTTCGVKATTFIPFDRRAIFIAFNRHTITELASKLPKHIDCATMHSVGMKSIRACYQQVNINKDKQIEFIKPIYEREKDHKKKWSKIYETDQIVSLIRATLTELTLEKVKELGEKHNLYPDDDIIYGAITATNDLYHYNNTNDGYSIMIDFQDMISIPALQTSVRVPQYDYVFLDEGQDASALDQKLIQRLLKPIKGRLIVFGDDRQAIYAFRGSDINSFNYFTSRPNTIQLPLTISYRCARSIVNKARTVYKEIEPWDKAIEGKVNEKGTLDEIKDGDMVLCRNLKPLVHAFLVLIDKGKRATIVGKDLEKGLINMISQLDDNQDVNELKQHLEVKRQQMVANLNKKNIHNVDSHPKMVQFEEKIGVINLLSSSCDTVGEVITKLQSLFSDDNTLAPIKLMTIHKSKGLEADNVFLIDKYESKKLIPSQYAVTADQKVQENNLLFVAYTRAKKSLTLVQL